MATLTDGSLVLSVLHLDSWETSTTVEIGYFCDGIPLLLPLIVGAKAEVPPGHVSVEDDARVDQCLTGLLRPALDQRRPVLWEDDEHCVSIIIYPPAFYYALSPVGSINWNDVLPGLGEDTRQRWLRALDGSQGTPMPNPEHVFMPEDDHPFIVQVKLRPTVLDKGFASGGLMFELHVAEPVLSTFLDDVDKERNAVQASGAG